MFERHLAFVLVAGHNHAGHPEEDDVRTCHQVGSGVVVLDLLVAGITDAVEEADGPQPAGEPGVEGILILFQIAQLEVAVAAFLAGKLQGLLFILGDNEAARRKIPSRDAVAPPQLTRDAPVLDVLKPMAIGVLVLGRIELDVIVHDRGQRDVGHVLHLQEPLHGKLRLDGHTCALRATYLVVVVLNLLHEASGNHVFGDFFAAGEALHTDILLQSDDEIIGHAHLSQRFLLGRGDAVAEGGIVVEDVYGLEVVLLAEHIVVDIVGRGDLQAACTKLDIYIFVLDDGDDAAHNGHNHLLALQPLVLWVVGVDAHGYVAHDGLRAGRGNDCVVTALILVDHVAFPGDEIAGHTVGQVVFHII